MTEPVLGGHYRESQSCPLSLGLVEAKSGTLDSISMKFLEESSEPWFTMLSTFICPSYRRIL